MREREVYLYVCLYQAYFRELLPIGVPQVDIFAEIHLPHLLFPVYD